MLFSVDEILLPRYVNLSTNFKEPLFRVEMPPSLLKHMYFILSANTPQTTKTMHSDWSSLNNCDISDEYTITLRNKFNALQEIFETLTPNDKYENFVNTHMEPVAECIPTKLTA